jgi:hypothetical protein
LAVAGADLWGLPGLNIQGVTVAMLALLALDTLVERVTSTEKIDQRLARLEAPQLLHDRSELMPIQQLSVGASEIVACGITLVSVVTPHHDFFASKLAQGVKLRFIILDPKCAAWQVWHESQRIATRGDVDATLETLAPLVRAGLDVEVRLAPFHLPVSLVIVDRALRTGRMTVEMTFTALSLPNRPHMYLTRAAWPTWFDFFAARFDYLWSISRVWEPDAPLQSG